MFNKKLIILILLTIFCIGITISSVSANDNSTSVVSTEQNSDEELQINEINEFENIGSDSLYLDEEKSNEDGLKIKNNDIVCSNDDSGVDTKVYLIEPSKTSYYVLTSINKYPNVETQFIIHVSPYESNRDGGTVTLKFNGNSYSATVSKGEAIITAKTPSKVGKYEATLEYSGYTFLPTTVSYNGGWLHLGGATYNPSSSTFTLNIIGQSNEISVNAPSVTNFYKANKYFKVTVKKDGKSVNGLKLNVKVYTGSKFKTYTIKTDKNGVAKLSTKKLGIGSHKVQITSKDSNYKISKTSKIVIKKKVKISKKTSKTKIITLKVKENKDTIKKIGKYTIKAGVWKVINLYPHYTNYVDIALYKNGKLLKTSKYLSTYKYKENGKWKWWNTWRHGRVNHVYHRYITDLPVSQVKVKWVA